MAQEMLSRIREGDEAALAELLEVEWAGLVAFLARRLPSEAAAQDAAQEAFVRLWERRESWRAGSARALLYRIAANAAVDLGRRERVRRTSDRRAPYGAGAPPLPDQEMIAAEIGRRVAAAVEALAPKRREVFRLVRSGGLTYREVAEVLEISTQTVANHMSLALAELRVSLADLVPHARAAAHRTTLERSTDG